MIVDIELKITMVGKLQMIVSKTGGIEANKGYVLCELK